MAGESGIASVRFGEDVRRIAEKYVQCRQAAGHDWSEANLDCITVLESLMIRQALIQ